MAARFLVSRACPLMLRACNHPPESPVQVMTLTPFRGYAITGTKRDFLLDLGAIRKETKMTKQRLGQILFWIGLVIAIAFASLGTWSLMGNLRTLTAEELDATAWAVGDPLFILWALSVAVGSVVAATGAFLYVRAQPAFPWLTAVGVLVAVILMVMVWSKVYSPALFGIGGILILLSFFAVVWVWMRKYAGLDTAHKTAGSFKLIGYIFWINASWFLCGETGKMHLKAFEGQSPPSPIEIMVFLVLGWLFVLLGDYKEMRIGKAE